MMVTILLILVAAYLVCGLVFAIPFLLYGITKMDEGARGSQWGFRLIILPGTIVFWPVLLTKWMKTAKNKKP
jgi:hypothetical protein